MLHWRIVYYLLQFALSAVGGSFAYLSLRAWFERSDRSTLREAPHQSTRWIHLVRGASMLFLAGAAFINAERETAGSMDGVLGFIRVASYIIFFLTMAPDFRRTWPAKTALAIIAAGEILLNAQNHFAIQSTLSQNNIFAFSGLLLIIGGLTFLGVRGLPSVVSIRLVDRLVISFAVFGLLLALVVAFLVVALLTSLDTNDLGYAISTSEKPLLMFLSGVVTAAALIGWLLAREVSEPVTRIGIALREIGEGKLDSKIELGNRPRNDEMAGLAYEIEKMAAQLKVAEQLRSEFLLFVSHELRNPLTSIKGCISTVESVKDLSDAERSEFNEIVLGETDRLLRMINELVDLSRVQTGKPLTINREWFDINLALKKMVNMFGQDKKNHALVYDGFDEPVMVHADSDKLQQIVVNLLSNAVKYSPDGGEVKLTLEADQAQVSISVQDQGVGMTEDQCKRAFDKFYRVSENQGPDSSMHLRRIEGAGVGLYLTRALIEAHGGGIYVSSQPRVGSTFSVTLPRQIPTPALVESVPGSHDSIPSDSLIRFGGESSTTPVNDSQTLTLDLQEVSEAADNPSVAESR
jgi:signal transduction histidine kinase